MCISLGLLDDMSRGMQEACYDRQRYDIKGLKEDINNMKYRPMGESMIKKDNTYYPPKCPECYIFNSIHHELEWNTILKS